MEMRNLVENSPRIDSFIVDQSEMPYIGQNNYTIEFWYKGQPSDWDERTPQDLPTGYQMILTGQQYFHGPGAINIYLDAGTGDMPGGGITNTSETEGQAFGSVVLSVAATQTTRTENRIPLTGEIVTTKAGRYRRSVAPAFCSGALVPIRFDGVLAQRKDGVLLTF